MNKKEILDHLSEFHSIEVNDGWENHKSKPSCMFGSVKNSTEIIRAKSRMPTLSLKEILTHRSSKRELNKIKCNELLSVLHESLKVKHTLYQTDNLVLTSRPYPSSGGIHPFETICITNEVDGLQQGCWFYEPFSSKIILTNIPNAFIESFNQNAYKLLNTSQTPAAIILLVANPYRTLTKYKNGLSLMWRDCGNLLATISYVAQAHRLHSCQLGVSYRFEYEELIGLSGAPLWISGAICIGS